MRLLPLLSITVVVFFIVVCYYENGDYMYVVEKASETSFIKRFDYILFTSVMILSVIGLIAVESATRTMPNGKNMMSIQTISVVMGVVLAIIVSLIDYKVYKELGWVLFGISTLLLVYVLFRGYGEQELGSSSWLRLPGGISFQPSEIAKITFIITVSHYLERIKEENKKLDYLKLIAVAVIPIALIILQPDYGTSMVFIFTLFVMLFVWGIKYKYLFMALGLFVTAAPFIWVFMLNDARRKRIIEFLFPGSDPLGSSLQVERAKMAIGSGRLFGSGIGKGIQTQNVGSGVPVKESDFIFTVIGEEMGFVGASVVIILIFVILLRCLIIAKRSRDLYGSYIVAGITGMFGFHFFENIGMNIGLLPVTGLPLPFVSQGGSAMVTNFIAIGLVLSVSARRKQTLFNTDD